MARKKAYIESEVIEKAMNLFWRNGYETTSMQMLEKEMGINKFSIYASFGSKNGVFLESLECYKAKLNGLLTKLKESEKGVTSIKTYFYDFLDFSKNNEFGKGCLITNTANEIGEDADAEIKKVLTDFTSEVRGIFKESLQKETSFSQTSLNQKADYLIIAMFGLASASRMFQPSQLKSYIENTFDNL
ncbi:TetR/AcrR family transcriptional regulator [Euzebyella saccharophila]|uniref:TetR/AcrR family transcriptional regulator n=1 Tax=Euzebyella saccharophila TaxID=679664 RepID=A0ABV8JRQ2_9FLAO|nr:TetR/AcrR family transcriptional regulator [Euzebyella saccharophila]